MITLNVIIEYDTDTPWIKILNVSDQHVGHADYARKNYRKILKENLSEPNSYLITNGDGIDCVTPRDPRFQIGGIDPAYLQYRPDEILDHQVDDCVAEHEPYKDQIIGLGMGNHELSALRHYGTNPHQRICKALGVRNLGYSCILQLILRPRGTNGRSRTFRILQSHGFGGSTRTEGGALSTFAAYANYFNVDAAFFGHKHDIIFKRFPRIGVDRNAKQIHEDVIVALTGSFLKTFNTSDVPNYAEQAGYRPTVLRGGWVLKIMPQWEGGVLTKMSEA